MKVAAKEPSPPRKTPETTPPASSASPASSVPAPSEKETLVEEKATAAPPAAAPTPPTQEKTTTATTLASSPPAGRSAEYAAAVALLDGGRFPAAAQSFQQVIAAGGQGEFTLQLMIACQPDTVTRARAQSVYDHSLFVLPYAYKGQSCFRTCWGIYPDKEAARAAIGRLPRVFSEAGIKPIVVALERLRGSR